MSFLLSLLPQHLRKLLERKSGPDRRLFLSDAPGIHELPHLVSAREAADPKEPSLEPPLQEPWYFLTAREREVTALVYMGHRNYEIAETLGVGYGTVQTHLQHIFDKFGLRSRKELRRALQGWQAEAWWGDNHS